METDRAKNRANEWLALEGLEVSVTFSETRLEYLAQVVEAPDLSAIGTSRRQALGALALRVARERSELRRVLRASPVGDTAPA